MGSHLGEHPRGSKVVMLQTMRQHLGGSAASEPRAGFWYAGSSKTRFGDVHQSEAGHTKHTFDMTGRWHTFLLGF